MLKVTSLAIESFRRFPKNSEIVIGPYLTLIVGQNATSKSTLLGMLCQPFEFKSDYKVYTDAYNNLDKKTTKTIAGKLYEADFSYVFTCFKERSQRPRIVTKGQMRSSLKWPFIEGIINY